MASCMAEKPFFTVAARVECSAEIKKSVFLAQAFPVQSGDEALSLIQRFSDPEATHNCWAYKIGTEYRFSDDGEPGGTAGRPILSAIEGQGLDHVLVLVTRHFGGIKLGAGGLVRAYGGSAAECLRRSRKLEIKPRAVLTIQVPFRFENLLYPILEELESKRIGEVYTAEGPCFTIELDEEKEELLTYRVNELTSGNCSVKRTSA